MNAIVKGEDISTATGLQLADIFAKELGKETFAKYCKQTGHIGIPDACLSGSLNSKNLNMTLLWIKVSAIKVHMIGFCTSLNNKVVVKEKKKSHYCFTVKFLQPSRRGCYNLISMRPILPISKS